MLIIWGFPCGSAGKESSCNVGDPWVGKIPWRRERLPPPVFWPGEFHGHNWVTFMCLLWPQGKDQNFRIISLWCVDLWQIASQLFLQQGWVYSRSAGSWKLGFANMVRGFPGSWDAGESASACNAGDPALVPGLRRSPREGNGILLQYSCLENPIDRGVWCVTVHGVTESWTKLSD